MAREGRCSPQPSPACLARTLVGDWQASGEMKREVKTSSGCSQLLPCLVLHDSGKSRPHRGRCQGLGPLRVPQIGI